MLKKDVPAGEIQDGLEGNGMTWSQEREVGATLNMKHSRSVFGVWFLGQNQ